MSDQPTSIPAPTAYDLAVSIAHHLGGTQTWTAQRRDTIDDNGRRYVELRRPEDRAEISVSLGGFRREGRITFRAHWPKYRDGRVYSPRKYLSITCSAGRDPKTLAREVERRLLANYEPAYREALADVQASDSATTSAWVAAERIARIVGADLPAPHNRPNNGASVPLHLSSSHVHALKVHPPYGERSVLVSFDVHDVDAETALEMLALLAPKQPDA